MVEKEETPEDMENTGQHANDEVNVKDENGRVLGKLQSGLIIMVNSIFQSTRDIQPTNPIFSYRDKLKK